MLAAAINSVIGGGVSTNPLRFYAPLTTSIALVKGAGIATFTRGAAATIIDHEGIIRNCKPTEARFYGARRVANLLLAGSENIDLDFNVFTSATIGNSFVTFGASSTHRVYTPSIVPEQGRTYVISAQVWTDSGSKGFRFFANSTISGNITATTTPRRVSATITAGAPNTENFGVRNSSDGLAGTVRFTDIQIEDVTGQANQNPSEFVSVGAVSSRNSLAGNNATFDTGVGDWINGSTARGDISWDLGKLRVTNTTGKTGYARAVLPFNFEVGKTYAIRVDVAVSAGIAGVAMTAAQDGVAVQTISGANTTLTGYFTPTAAYPYIQALVNSATADNRYVTFDNIVISEVTHGANVDGVKYFDYANGNTVDGSNVVTEAQGAALTTCKGYLSEWTRTNSFTYGCDLSNAAWTKVATTQSAYTGADAIYSSLYELRETVDNSSHGIMRANPLASNVHQSFSFIYKPTGTAARNIRFTHSAGLRAMFNPTTGVATNQSYGANTTFGYARMTALAGGFFLCEMAGIPDTTSGGFGTVYYELADGSTITYVGNTAVGGVVGMLQCEAGTHATTYIHTTTSTAGRSYDLLEYSTAGNFDNTKGSCYGEATLFHTPGTVATTWRGRLITGLNNHTALNLDPNAGGRTSGWDGNLVMNGATNSAPWTYKNTEKAASSWGNGYMRSSGRGLVGAETTFDGTIHPAEASFRVGSGATDSTALNGCVKNLTIYRAIKTPAQLQAMTA